LVGTHYGFYNTIVGIGILAGNLATGARCKPPAPLAMKNSSGSR